MLRPLTIWITTNCEKLKEMGTQEHPACLLRNRHADQGATIRNGHRTTDRFRIGKEVHQFSSVQSSHSVVSDSLQPHELQHTQASLSITNTRSSLRLTSIQSVMPSSHLILCRPFLLLPSILPSITVFSNESTLRMRWP